VALTCILTKQSIDTTMPTGRLMFQICGAFVEFERCMIRQRISAGLSRAKAQGKRLGRPPVSHAIERRAQRHLVKEGILKVVKTLGLGTGTVHRIKRAMDQDVSRWGRSAATGLGE
jgi:DNA invertase Pin-like site-specific DNA recombinase